MIKKLMIFLVSTLILLVCGCSAKASTTISSTSTTTITSTISTTTTVVPTTTTLLTTTLCDHEIETVEGKEETCVQDGLTSGLWCPKCGKVFVEQTIIPASHDMELTSISLTSNDNYKRPVEYTCSRCGYKETKELTSEDLGLPIVTIFGSLSGITKETKTLTRISYENGTNSFETSATIKLQGSSSLAYPKKNYNIQFLNEDSSKYKVELQDGWGKESKYCLKANYVDFTEARNVVSAKIYGQIVHSRNISDNLDTLVNGGAVDGFPVVVYNENEFLGIYTMNIPKDKWLFGMGKGEKEAILMGNSWTNSVALREDVASDFSNGWELEYCSTDDTSWVTESFNTMIDFVTNSSYINFSKHLSEYVNEERAIDSMLYTMIIEAVDNCSKNILWVTYDGKTWTPSVYDMDDSMGLYWDGGIGTISPSGYMPNVWKSSNVLWEKLFQYKSRQIATRYFELRESIITIENIENEYLKFMGKIKTAVYTTEKTKWTGVPSQDTNNLNSILVFMNERINLLDAYFASVL